MGRSQTSDLLAQAQYHADELNKILGQWHGSDLQIFVGNDRTVDLLLPDGSLLRQGVCGQCEKRIQDKLTKGVRKHNAKMQ
jgi:hypothetical protein